MTSMNANAYSEDQMIQAGTADFFAEHLGWRSVYAFDRKDFGADSLLGRSHRGEVVLLRGLRQALKKPTPRRHAAMSKDWPLAPKWKRQFSIISTKSCRKPSTRTKFGC